jgi:hypothetical protein
VPSLLCGRRDPEERHAYMQLHQATPGSHLRSRRKTERGLYLGTADRAVQKEMLTQQELDTIEHHGLLGTTWCPKKYRICDEHEDREDNCHMCYTTLPLDSSVKRSTFDLSSRKISTRPCTVCSSSRRPSLPPTPNSSRSCL